ncbi:MAG: cytochrome c3 family protein [Panacagrimonas sp.]
MRTLIRRVDNKKGTIAFVDRTVDAPSVRVGRGTDQELQLSDMRVALAHAEIEPVQPGPYRIEAKTANGVWVNGGPCPVSTLNFGDTVDCGHYRLTILKPDLGTDLAIMVEEKQNSDDEQDGSGTRFVTELRHTRLSRRGLAWAGFWVVLLTMLLVPLTVRYGTSAAKSPDRRAAAHSIALPSDQLWSSGPISSAHAFFETDCASCHVEPFAQVRNASCLECHDLIRHHVNDLDLVSTTDFSGAECTDCHREHNGPEGTIVRLPDLCTDCHASPSERFPGTKLENVRNFSEEHPAFSPLVSKYDPVEREFSMAPVAQGKGVVLEEATNLSFPHDLHLDAKGVDAPGGKKKVLECANCHSPDRGQISFEPITMEKHCAECHRLEFDTENYPDRVVPHGQPAEVAAVLRDFFAAQALSGNLQGFATLDQLPPTSERRRPGPVRPRATRETAAKWSEQQGEQKVRDVFNTNICTYCHVVSAGSDPQLPWIIAPVSLKEHAMAGAWFTHKPHAFAPCSDCHEAGKSKSSSDVLLPEIANCRDCHGDVGQASQVNSDCIDCHRYHSEPAPLWDPEATQRRREAAETAHAKIKVHRAGMSTGGPE